MTFSTTHLVQFSETDMAGVVHFSNYFRWMEEVEHAFFRSVGLTVHANGTRSVSEGPAPERTRSVSEGPAASDADAAISWPRVFTSCEYLAPARFEDEVTLHLRLTRLGEKSLSYEVDFLIDNKPIAKAKLTSVCCSITPTTFTPIPIPPAIRAKLAATPR